MDDWKRILVAVDLAAKGKEVSHASRNAVEQAAWIALQNGATLRLLHSTWAAGQEGAVQLARRRQTLARLADELVARGIACESFVVGERAWLALIREVQRGGGDVVLLGKRDEEESEWRKIGSVATKVLRKCPGPVWLVKPGHDLEHKLILSATDLTPVGDQAVALGAWVSERSEAEHHVVHAYRVPPAIASRADELGEEGWSARLEELRTTAQARIQAALAAAGTRGESILHVGRNSAFSAIKEALEHLHPDLLVMGTISHGGRPGFQLGDTAERILSRVDCSVLTLKPADFVSPIA